MSADQGGLTAAPDDESPPTPAVPSTPAGPPVSTPRTTGRRPPAAGRDGARDAARRDAAAREAARRVAAREAARREAAASTRRNATHTTPVPPPATHTTPVPPPASPVLHPPAPSARPVGRADPGTEVRTGEPTMAARAASAPPMSTPLPPSPAPRRVLLEPPRVFPEPSAGTAPASSGPSVETEAPPAAPRLTRKQRKAMTRMRARKVRRVVRHIDPWSVLKLSLFFYLCMFVIMMVAGVILWNIARQAGTIDDVQNLFKELGLFKTFTFEGDRIFRASTLGGLVLVITFTGLNVLFAVLFNLISDLVGGVRMTVIEEETARPVASSGLVPAGMRRGADGALRADGPR